MKISFPSLILLILSSVTAVDCLSQNTVTTFYDYKWKECDVSVARFYSLVEKTDSGYLRKDYFVGTNNLQMAALYKDPAFKIINGHVHYYYANGNLQASGRLVDNNKEGVYVSYHFNGMMADSGFYSLGKFIGYKLSWYTNGMMADSFFRKDDSTTVYVKWFDDGTPSHYGIYLHGKEQGKWNYFHKNGVAACTEVFDRGNRISVVYFDESGKAETDTSKINRDAVFKKGLNAWQNYLLNKTYWPPEYRLTNSNTASVVVGFTVNEDGKVEDVFIATPFHPLMDKIALDVIQKSPDWKPAIDHNRRIKQTMRQPVTFSQDAE